MISKLFMYLQYPFVQYAVIVGTLIALCSALMGVILVLKRFSYIGDGLSHVAFGAMSVATVLRLSGGKMFLILPVTVIAAVLLLRSGKNARISGDAKTAMISTGALAFGYLLMNIYSTSANVTADVCTTLFGSTSILTLTAQEVWLCIILSVITIVLFICMYNRIFCISFDEDFAASAGIRTEFYNLGIAVVIAVIIVLAMNLVGSLLISALVIFPAISAMQLFRSFKSVTICSAVMSVVCSLTGMFTAIIAGTPVGSTIVAADVIVFFAVMIISAVMRGGRQ
ncbi:MAG: metal ABC transporter permease [Solobacterium sp.]|nr:metal ABC transporter permease [Solobacterium sp.]